MEARDFVRDLQLWGFTQKQIEDRTGITQATVSKIARGTVQDILSRAYRRLQAVHQEEAAKRAAEKAAPATAQPTATGG